MKHKYFHAGAALSSALLLAGCSAAGNSGNPTQMTSQASTVTCQNEPFEPTETSGPNHLLVFADERASGWVEWDVWGADAPVVSSPVHTGAASYEVTYTTGWGSFRLTAITPVSMSDYTHVRFWIHGGTSVSQQLVFYVQDSAGVDSVKKTLALQAGQWTQVEYSLAELGNPADIKRMFWDESDGTVLETFYLDDITLVARPSPPLTLNVDAAANRHPISPDIYGINGAKEDLNEWLALPVRRWGGNNRSRYNHLTDTTNTGSDWFFENVLVDVPGTADKASYNFIEQDRAAGTKTIITVPLMGWVAKDWASCSFNTNKLDANGNPAFPPQNRYDTQWRSWCGNGLTTANPPLKITANVAATDTSIPADPTFVGNWVRDLVARYGTAANGGVKFYSLDNEPMLWNETHRDVWPTPAGYDDVRDLAYAYAAAIKHPTNGADPSAKTLGPVVYGWNAYRYSAQDWAAKATAPNGEWWNVKPDRMAHDDKPFVPWYLEEMKKFEDDKTTPGRGYRILDYLDVHYYPSVENEQPEVALKPAGDECLQRRRLRTTRSLWDPDYVDESWIDEPVRLLPRMREWVDQNYPHTKLAISEYNFGALDHINGALAQADVLGIFGRERLDLATLWYYGPDNVTTFETHHPGAFAFRMYRNYDGQGSAFGETTVSASSTYQNRLSVYAAERTGGTALTVMVINKTQETLQSPLSIANFPADSSARVFRYSESNLTSILTEPPLQVSYDATTASYTLTASYPPNSITLVEIPRAIQ